MTSFDGRVIALTGAASGIALATARLLASRGASISVADVRKEPLDAAVADIKKAYPDVKIYAKAVNAKNAREVADWLDETIKYLGLLSRTSPTRFLFVQADREHRDQCLGAPVLPPEG